MDKALAELEEQDVPNFTEIASKYNLIYSD